jgi:hypothetical protein
MYMTSCIILDHAFYFCSLGRKTSGLASAMEAHLRFPVLRGIASFLLVLTGGSLFLLSIPAAFGWYRGPVSIGGAVIAILGLAAIFGGYWLVRTMDGGPVAAVCVKVALGFGSTFLLVGLIAAFLPGDQISPRRPDISLLLVACVSPYSLDSAHIQGITRTCDCKAIR